MASITPQQLFSAVQVGSGATVLYVIPGNTTVQVKKLTFANPTGAARQISVYLLAQNQNPGDATVLVKNRTIAPQDTFECYFAQGHILPASGTIQAIADQLGAVVAQGSGILIS